MGSPPATTPPAIVIQARREQLTSAELAALRVAVERDRPAFKARASGPLQLNVIVQPFFARHRVLEITSPMPFPAVKIYVLGEPGGAMRVLSGHLENLVAAATAEPPAALDSLEGARAFGNLGDAWTTDSEYGDFLVESFAAIPWKPRLTEEERAHIAKLEGSLGHTVTPLKVSKEGKGYVLSKWVVANQRLVERRVHVPRDGRIRREEQVRAADLPVFPGRTWGFVNGRLVPTG